MLFREKRVISFRKFRPTSIKDRRPGVSVPCLPTHKRWIFLGLHKVDPCFTANGLKEPVLDFRLHGKVNHAPKMSG